MNKSTTNKLFKITVFSIIALLVVFLVYKLRAMDIFHGTFMLFYQYPFLWIIPLIGFSLWALLSAIFTISANNKASKAEKENDPKEVSRTQDDIFYDRYMTGRSQSYSSSNNNARNLKIIHAGWWIGVPLTILWIVLIVFIHPINSAKLAKHVGYNQTIDISKLSGGEVRIKPYEVADAQIAASFSSSIEEIEKPHIVLENGKLTWTAPRGPRGFWRKLNDESTGLVKTSAETTASNVQTEGKSVSAKFKYSPTMKVSQNTTWQIRTKFCYTCELKEAVGVSTPQGPRVLISYTRLKGNWYSKYSVFGGVFVVYPNGTIKQYSPNEALKVPMIIQSGRMFPEDLARKYADVFKYHLGVTNRAFSHKDGYEPIDTDSNPQPYLETFKDLPNPQWVTTMQPRGRAGAVGVIMFTDAITGNTRIWRAPSGTPYLSNTRAINTVKSLRINGLNFTNFKPVEPRQVFPNGKLSYLISVIPSNGSPTRVTLNIVMDGVTGRTRIFDADDHGDAALIKYLNGEDDGSYVFDDSSSAGSGDVSNDQSTPTVDDNTTTVVIPKNDKERQKIVKQLIKQNAIERKQLEALLDK